MIRPPPLPYSEDALLPYLSPRTVHFHRRKQVRYVERTVELVQGTSIEDLSLGEIVRASESMLRRKNASDWAIELCEQASQAWNHALMWLSMSPASSSRRRPPWASELREEWFEQAASILGSGWVWLIVTPEGEIMVDATHDADRPEIGEPLAVMDLWEHAYYLDLPDQKNDYVRMWWDHLADWSVAAKILRGETPKALA